MACIFNFARGIDFKQSTAEDAEIAEENQVICDDKLDMACCIVRGPEKIPAQA